ncbi:MAG: hypothetical protein ACTSPB_15630 [Candidatus Thorarchaeota archaeon]
MTEIQEPIRQFVAACVESYPEFQISVEPVFRSQISGSWQNSGSGICIKMDAAPLNPRSPNPNETGIWFTVSDGNYAIECLIHNGTSVPEGHSDESLESSMMTLRESLRNGTNIGIEGCYHIVNREKIFLVHHVYQMKNHLDSQMTDEQLEQFLSLCAEHKIRPLDLLMRDDTLWSEFYSPEVLKKAVMLYCLSPQNKGDLLHIGLVTSMGEGKDHLIERVVQPLVPVGVAGSGKMSTIAGLFGAMSGDDLSSIELGLIPKMNHERLAVSEFQTWDDTVFGELMNVMANGKFEMQKGQLDISRPGCVNMMFLGNPPRHWDGETHKKTDMLESFGDYTYQILSRLTLIFTQMSLSGPEAERMIEEKIMDAMNGKFDDPEVKREMTMWRTFCREYLRKVSLIRPEMSADIKSAIRETYHGYIKNKQEFIDVFLARSEKDMRKYQEFTNLCRAFARLDGSAVVDDGHISEAMDIFLVSLKTLHENFPLDELEAGMSGDDFALFEAIKGTIKDLERLNLKDLRGMMLDRKISDADLKKLEKAGYLKRESNPDGSDYIVLVQKGSNRKQPE